MTRPDLVRDVLGIELNPERVSANLAEFADVLEEISKLRGLDLKDVQPAVLFAPLVKRKIASDD